MEPDPDRVEAGYLESGGEQLYRVLHRSSRRPPIGGVLLAGPWGAERGYAYGAWRRWAEHLAAAGFDVLRFDYRGIGESTGPLERMRFADWVDDARICIEFLFTRTSSPLFLHGLRFGSFVCASLHASGFGEGMLLWNPPKSGQRFVDELLGTRLAEDAALPDGSARRTRGEWMDELAAGRVIDVGGYPISARLWREMAARPSPPSRSDGAGRVSVVQLLHRKRAQRGSLEKTLEVSIPFPPFWRPSRILTPDLRELFAMSLLELRRMVDSTRRARCGS